MNVADILDKAADLIEPEGAWTQGAFARTADGESCSSGSSDPRAVCWCVGGAINRASGQERPTDAHNVFQRLIPCGEFEWNDAPERTQAEVVAKLREAARLAREGSPMLSQGEASNG